MKKNSTKILAATLALVMVAAMTACGSSNSSSSVAPSVPPTPPSSSTPSSESTPPAPTPEELAKKYEEAIVAARDEELNKYYPVTSNANKESMIAGYIAGAKENGTELTPEDAEKQYTQSLDMLASVMGLKLEDAQAYAISTSFMNVKAYAVAVVKPMEGKEADVEKVLKDYVAAQQKSFESYLPDQKLVADAAIVKTLEDGTIVMVMSEKQDEICEAIIANLSK